MFSKCKHNYKPHKFIRCKHDICGNVIYVYSLQCIKCGKEPLFICRKSKNPIFELYDYKIRKKLLTIQQIKF